MADVLRDVLAEHNLLDLPDDIPEGMHCDQEVGELPDDQEVQEDQETTHNSSPVVEKAIQEATKLIATKDAKLTDQELDGLTDHLEIVDDKFLGLKDQTALMDLAHGKPRVLAMITMVLGLMPNRRNLFLPGLLWACMSHSKVFLEKLWKVILIIVLLRIPFCDAGCQTDANITYNEGKAVLHTAVMNYKTQLFTEEISLQPFTDLKNNLQKRVESVALSEGNIDDPPLQCNDIPSSPTDLLQVGKILNENHQFYGIFITPMSCNRRYTVIATLNPIGRYRREAIKAVNNSIPVYCSYYPSNTQQLHMLTAGNRDLNVPNFDNNPLDIYVKFIRQGMSNPDTNENCTFLGELSDDVGQPDNMVIQTATGLHECIELCNSIRYGQLRKNCKIASFDVLTSSCRISDIFDEGKLPEYVEYEPSIAVRNHYIINFVGKCLAKSIDYTTPDLMVGKNVAEASNICEYLLPEYREGLHKKSIGKITDGAKQVAIQMLGDLNNLTRLMENKYGVFDRYRRSTDTFNWNSNYNAGKSVLRLIQQISEVTKLGIDTWQNFATADQRPGFNNANLLQRMSSGLRSRGQQAKVFDFKTWPVSKNKLEIFGHQYAKLLNNSIAKVDIKRLYADFTMIRKWVLNLLDRPIPITVDLNQTKNFLYTPVVVKKNFGNTLVRRFLRILPDKQDLNNLLFAQFPTSAETYKEENFKSSFGPSNQWENCLSGDETSCKVVKGRTKQEITILPYGDRFDSSLVAINRDSFQLIVMCNEQDIYFKKHTGYTVVLNPPNCRLTVDNVTYVEQVSGSHSSCKFRILYSADVTYPSNSPPSLIMLIKENMKFSYKAFIFSLLGIGMVSLLYFNYCYKIQRRQRWSYNVAHTMKKVMAKENKEVPMEISRPIEPEDDYVQLEIVSTPTTKNRKEYHF